MSAGKGDPVAPPPGEGEYEIKYASKDAVEGWRELCKQASGNTLKAWQAMRTAPAPKPETDRHHRLKHEYATAIYQGKEYPQWQIEVTSGGRVWYLLDEARKTCWLKLAKTGHPRQTD